MQFFSRDMTAKPLTEKLTKGLLGVQVLKDLRYAQ